MGEDEFQHQETFRGHLACKAWQRRHEDAEVMDKVFKKTRYVERKELEHCENISDASVVQYHQENQSFMHSPVDQ